MKCQWCENDREATHYTITDDVPVCEECYDMDQSNYAEAQSDKEELDHLYYWNL